MPIYFNSTMDKADIIKFRPYIHSDFSVVKENKDGTTIIVFEEVIKGEMKESIPLVAVIETKPEIVNTSKSNTVKNTKKNTEPKQKTTLKVQDTQKEKRIVAEREPLNDSLGLGLSSMSSSKIDKNDELLLKEFDEISDEDIQRMKERRLSRSNDEDRNEKMRIKKLKSANQK
jgi:hypothetical protein